MIYSECCDLQQIDLNHSPPLVSALLSFPAINLQLHISIVFFINACCFRFIIMNGFSLMHIQNLQFKLCICSYPNWCGPTFKLLEATDVVTNVFLFAFVKDAAIQRNLDKRDYFLILCLTAGCVDGVNSNSSKQK